MCSFSDADDTKAWISEKDTALSSPDYGRDLASVQALQRKHGVLERDLAALEEKVRYIFDIREFLKKLFELIYLFRFQVRQLNSEADMLMETHPTHAQDIEAKRVEISEAWDGLKDQVYWTMCLYFSRIFYLLWCVFICKAASRKGKLVDSHDYQQFLNEYRW